MTDTLLLLHAWSLRFRLQQEPAHALTELVERAVADGFDGIGTTSACSARRRSFCASADSTATSRPPGQNRDTSPRSSSSPRHSARATSTPTRRTTAVARR